MKNKENRRDEALARANNKYDRAEKVNERDFLRRFPTRERYISMFEKKSKSRQEQVPKGIVDYHTENLRLYNRKEIGNDDY